MFVLRSGTNQSPSFYLGINSSEESHWYAFGELFDTFISRKHITWDGFYVSDNIADCYRNSWTFEKKTFILWKLIWLIVILTYLPSYKFKKINEKIQFYNQLRSLITWEFAFTRLTIRFLFNNKAVIYLRIS